MRNCVPNALSCNGIAVTVTEAPGRQGPALPDKPRLVRSEGGGPRSDGTSLSVTRGTGQGGSRHLVLISIARADERHSWSSWT